MDTFKEILNNPKTRIAASETGKKIIERLEESRKAKEAPILLLNSMKTDETVELLKRLIKAKLLSR